MTLEILDSTTYNMKTGEAETTWTNYNCVGYNGGYTFMPQHYMISRCRINLPGPATTITVSVKYDTKDYVKNLGTSTPMYVGLSKYATTINTSTTPLPAETTANFMSSGYTFYVSKRGWYSSPQELTITAASGEYFESGDWYIYSYRKQYSSGSGSLCARQIKTDCFAASANCSVPSKVYTGAEWSDAIPYIWDGSSWREVASRHVWDGTSWANL